MASGLSINTVALTIVAITIGIVLIGSLLAPTATDVMASLEALGDAGRGWAKLVGVVVIVSVIGLIVVAINQYTRN